MHTDTHTPPLISHPFTLVSGITASLPVGQVGSCNQPDVSSLGYVGAEEDICNQSRVRGWVTAESEGTTGAGLVWSGLAGVRGVKVG